MFASCDNKKILKSLHVTKLYLYPRFHTSIRNELEDEHNNNAIRVTEFYQPLSSLQKDIQNSIAAAVVKCLRQLKTSTEHIGGIDNTWDTELVSVENCVTSYFDRAIMKQLEPVWYKLRPQTISNA